VVTVVIPFAGEGGKTRLHESAQVRDALSAAMLEDVLAASRAVGLTRVAGQSGGQGAAVAAALAGIEGPVVIVNADLPCATTEDIEALAAAAPALVAAADGTTNALSLTSGGDFEPLYGPGSAARFGVLARPVSLPNLAEDVDTMDDLARLERRLGSHTRAALAELRGSLV
jgi:2-phospho-L-lactate guanylyltransferase (CobY/MobA/RfbA family)